MKANRIFLVTDNDRHGKALRLWLENEYTADVHLANAVEAEGLAESEAIVLDAHAAMPRSKCVAVQRVRAAREQGISTPFVILTWLPYQQAIVNPQLASNPFIGHYYRDSCRFLQLPVRPERLAEVLGEVRPCTYEEIALGKRFLDDISHAHRLSTA